MKTRSLSLLAVIAFGLSASMAVNAAETPAARGGLTNRADRVKAIAADLKLTPEQQEKLRPILLEEGQKAMEIFRDTNLSREAKMSKLKEVRDANRPKVKLILTPGQMEKWDKLRQGRQLENPQRARPAVK